MSFVSYNITFEQTLLIVVVLAMPTWIAGDYALDLIAQHSCGHQFISMVCSYHDPARRAVLPSLTIFHIAIVVGNSAIGWLVYRKKFLSALVVSIIVLGFFADFVLEYTLVAGDAQCAAFPDAVSPCRPSPSFLSLFLERYDKVYFALTPVQLVWVSRFLFQSARQKTQLR